MAGTVRYLRGECYRLLRKKSLYAYYAALAACYALVTYVRSGGFGPGSVVGEAINMSNFLPVLAGGVMFAAIYADDLGARNLTVLVGFGLGRLRIALSKLIIMAASVAVMYALVPVVHVAMFRLLGWPASPGDWAMIYAAMAKHAASTMAFAALSAVLAFGTQRATFAIVAYTLLAFGIVGGMAAAGLNAFAPGLSDHLMSGISDRVMVGLLGDGPLATPLAEYAAYVAAAFAASVAAFHRKEMEP